MRYIAATIASAGRIKNYCSLPATIYKQYYDLMPVLGSDQSTIIFILLKWPLELIQEA